MLSVIVPVLNEAPSLPQLSEEIRTSCDQAKIPYEIIFVDDGSNDLSWQTIETLSKQSLHIRGLKFRRNFGKAAALSAGMQAAQGEILMCMDADLQDDPKEIPRFLEKLNEGVDVVNGWKERRLDPWHKVYPSKVFNWMVSRLTGLSLHDHNCGFKCFRREVGREIRLYGELHRFIPVLAHARGFKVAEIPVHHRRREHGSSKYGFNRFLKGFLDLLTVKFLTGYGQRPQHLLGTLGVICFLFGTLGLAYLACLWMFTNLITPVIGLMLGKTLAGFGPIGNRPLLAYSVTGLLLGAQLLSLGFLAESIVARTSRDEEVYAISDRTGGGSGGTADGGLRPAGLSGGAPIPLETAVFGPVLSPSKARVENPKNSSSGTEIRILRMNAVELSCHHSVALVTSSTTEHLRTFLSAGRREKLSPRRSGTMNKKMHYGQALNLDQLRFEELGRSPITRMNELRRDTAEQPFSAHFLTCTRKGDRRDRELHSGGFEEYLI